MKPAAMSEVMLSCRGFPGQEPHYNALVPTLERVGCRKKRRVIHTLCNGVCTARGRGPCYILPILARIYIYIYVCIYVYIYIYIFRYFYIYVFVHLFTHTYIDAAIRTYIFLQNVCMCIYTYMYVNIPTLFQSKRRIVAKTVM